MFQKLFFLTTIVAVATVSEAHQQDWSKDCPQPEANGKYSEECYKATTPPPFVCKNMRPDEWVEKALDSYPRCCGDDLSECRCPVKNFWPPFKTKIVDYCAKVEICLPPGENTFLRGGVDDARE